MIQRIKDIADFTEIEVIEHKVFTDPFIKEVYIADFLHHPYSEYYKLVENHRIIGFFGLWVIYEDAQITTIAVDKEYQGKGYGNQLLEFIIVYLKERQCKNITLEVRVSNRVAIAFYEKYHFKIVATRKRYYENGEDAFLLKLDL